MSNPTRPSDSLKPLANRLAALLAENDGARTLGLMQRLGLAEGGAAPGRTAEAPPGAIGIWLPRTDAGKTRWVRGDTGEPWWPWADVETIAPKSERSRVVLIGESVARGYFYDPFFNPSAALADHLESTPGAPGVEVIDLARTDQRYDALLPLIRSSMALEPDAIVIFAGNNWSGFDGVDAGERVEIAAILRRGEGVRGVRDHIERRLERLTASLLAGVAEACSSKRVECIVVVPEFNLLDWHVSRRDVPYLDTERYARWMRARDIAEAALAGGDVDAAWASASEMLELDGGVSAVGPALLARCHLQKKETDRARPMLEQARDTELWMPLPTTPRCFSVTQRALRAESAKQGLTVVDLPERFQDLSGALPDRTMFHDYCHLTSAGIQAAMAPVAAELARRLWKRDVSWQDLARRPAPVAPDVVARAHLLAAVHNDTWGQAADVVRFHCAEAVRVAPEVGRAMSLVADMCTRRVPSMMTSAFNQLLMEGNMSIARFFVESLPLMRTKLVDAIVDVTQASDPELMSRITAVRKDEHGVGGCERDLVEPRFSRFSNDQLDGPPGPALYHRAFGQRSRFMLVCDGGAPVHFRLTCRGRAPEGEVRIVLNGHELHRFAVGSAWTSSRFEAAATHLRDGINEVVLVWPMPQIDAQAALATAADRVELGLAPDVYPPFGDVATFTALGTVGTPALKSGS